MDLAAAAAQPAAETAAPMNPRTHAADDAPLHLIDDPQEWASFGHALDAREIERAGVARGCWESNFVVQGMHCAACALTLEDALARVPGVHAVQVNAGSHRARVVWSPGQTRPSQWIEAIRGAGYDAVPAADARTRAERQREERRSLWRLGVAGFCMMQVMMYAVPAYMARDGDMSADMAQLLRWASWVLTLPVVFFSCGPFFRGAWRDLTQRRVSMDLPVALGMLITFVVSSAATFEPQGALGAEVYFDSLTMFVFFLLAGRWFELRLRERTAGALEALMNRLPDSAWRQASDGSWAQVAVRVLRVGDRVRVLPGQAFPADGTLIEGDTLADEALMSGESTPLARAVGDAVLAGSHNLARAVVMRVEHIGAATRFAGIVRLMEEASTQKPRLARIADRAARPFLWGVLAAALAAAAWHWPEGAGRALMAAAVVLIVTCPCALSLATPAAMLASAGALARRGVLVRNLQALETLAGVDTLVFDKTGTLTQGGMRLDAIDLAAGVTRAQVLAVGASLAAGSLHPVSRSLVLAAAEAAASEGVAAHHLREQAGQGVSGHLDVAQAARLGVPAGEWRLGSPAFCAWPDANLAAGADRPMACLSGPDGWVATFHFAEDVRADAGQAVAALREQGLAVQMLSGDRQAAAERVGLALGLRAEEAQGDCTPDGKLARLRALQAQGHAVAMVGDGLNDGPVLAGAQVSVAFGQAVPLAQSRADLVVLGQQLSLLPMAIAQARRTLRVVRQNLAWAALYNAVCVPLALAGWLPAWLAGLGMALSSLLVVLNAARLSRRPEEVFNTVAEA